MGKLIKWLFEKPSGTSCGVESKAVLIFLLITAISLLIGVPPSLTYAFILTLMLWAILPFVILLFTSGLIVFAFIVFHNLLPLKPARRNWLKMAQKRLLKNRQPACCFYGFCFMSYLIGSALAVIGLTGAIFIPAGPFLIQTIGHTGKTLTFVFGGFLTEVILGYCAFLILTSKETKELLVICQQNDNQKPRL